jgi:hypothetical protein
MTENQLKELIREEYHNVKDFMEEKYGFTPELGKVIDNPYVSAFKAEDYLNEESELAYLLRRMADVGGAEAEEFLSNNKVSLYKIKLALRNNDFTKYDLRDVIQGKAARSIKKKVMRHIKESTDDTISEELRPDEVEFIIKKLGNSMPNHTSYDYDKGPTGAQVLKALKKYHRDFFRHSTTKQKKEIVNGIQKYLTESTDEVVEEYDVETLDETRDFINFMKEYKSDINEAEYQGRDVKLGKPMQGDVKKFKVYVKNPKGNVVKVNFGAKGMNIKKNNPERRKSFRARMNCDNPGPRHKARYWSCRKW